MLVDSEEDKKVHRPVTPKDVGFLVSILVISLHNIDELCRYSSFPFSTWSSAGS